MGGEDHVLIDLRLTRAENDIQDVVKDIARLDGESSNQSDRILTVEHWKDGVGCRGAEARLQCVEAKLDEGVGDVSEDLINKIAGAAAIAIVGNARKRDKTTVEKVKAVAPYFASVCLLAANILQAVLR